MVGVYVSDVLRGIGRQLDPRRREPTTRRMFWVWTVLSVVLGAMACLDLVNRFRETGDLALVLTLLRVAPLPWLRARPSAGWWFSVAATTLNSALVVTETWPWPGGSVLVTLAVLGVVGHAVTTPAAVVVWLITNGSGLVLVVCFPNRAASWHVLIAVAAATAVVLVVVQAHRERSEALRKLVAAEREFALQRDRRSQLEERTRIARELHDVVAHHMSVIAVQAGSAPIRVSTIEQANREFESLAGSARSSLSEMRHLLRVLRSENGEGEHDPGGKGIDELPTLLENVAGAGVPVTLQVQPEVRDVRGWSSTGQLTIYRVVQEGLSNVVRHAPGARAGVRLALHQRELLIEVYNEPTSSPDGRSLSLSRDRNASPNSPRGLRGIAERAAMLDGSVSAVERDDGGFTLSVRLSLPLLLDHAAS